MAHQTASICLLIVVLMFNHATAKEQVMHPLRAQVTAGVRIDHLLNRDILGVRQASQTCEVATDTICPDGNGCCPYGSPCEYTTTGGSTFGVCGGVCPIGAATCTTPITACCLEVGATCGLDGTCTLPAGSLSRLPSNSPVSSSPPESVPADTSSTSSAPQSTALPPPSPPTARSSSSEMSQGTARSTSASEGHTNTITLASSSQQVSSQSSGPAVATAGSISLTPLIPLTWAAIILAYAFFNL